MKENDAAVKISLTWERAAAQTGGGEKAAEPNEAVTESADEPGD